MRLQVRAGYSIYSGLKPLLRYACLKFWEMGQQTCGVGVVADALVVQGHHGHAMGAGPAAPCSAQKDDKVQQCATQDGKTALLLPWLLVRLTLCPESLQAHVHNTLRAQCVAGVYSILCQLDNMMRHALGVAR